MGIKEFLKPEWKKFVLPVIFVTLFLVAINAFYSYGSVIDKHGCETISLYKELQDNINKNDTVVINQTMAKWLAMSQNMERDILRFEVIVPVFTFLNTIDPVFTLPCEVIGSNCEFYINEDTYKCFFGMKDNNTFLSLAEPPEYKKASIATFSLNILILFAEGYLLSAVVLFGWRRTKKTRTRKK